MKLHNLIEYLESVLPTDFQESYDNSGLQLGDPSVDISSALLTLDVTESVLEEAITKKCQLIISHHPLIFSGIKRLSGRSFTERIILRAIKNNIAVYSAHTNLDIVQNGVSYSMAKLLKLKNVEVLVPLSDKLIKLIVFVPLSHAGLVRDSIFKAGAGHIGGYRRCSFNVEGNGTFMPGENTDPFVGEIGFDKTEKEIRIETVLPAYLKSKVVQAMLEAHPYEEVAYDLFKTENEVPGAGLGCVGELDQEMLPDEFINLVSSVFDSKGIRHSSLNKKPLKRVAVMGGSGSAYVKNAISCAAEVYISGEIRYHDYFEAENRILLMDIGHYESEKPALSILYDIITKKFPKFAVRFSEINTNPVNYSQVWQK